MKKLKKHKWLFPVVITIVFTVIVVVGLFIESRTIENSAGTNSQTERTEMTEDKNKSTETENGVIRNENVAIDKETGIQYVKDELIVLAYLGTDMSEIEKIAEKYECVLVNENMADMDVYLFKTKKSTTYKELNDLLEKIETESAIESAYINTASEISPDIQSN